MSLSRERLKSYAKLKQKKYRSIQGRFIVEGARGIRDIAAADEDGRLIDAVLYTPEFLKDPTGERLLITVRSRGSKVYEVDENDLARVSDTIAAQGIVAVVNGWGSSIEEIYGNEGPEIIVAVDGIREPGNLGTLIRTCDWFGVGGILLGKGTVEIWNPKVVRSAVGSMVNVPFVENADLKAELPALRSRGYTLYCTSVSGGISIAESILRTPAVIIFGNEAEGVSRDLQEAADGLITIPKYGKAESLNVGVSAGVILSAIRFGA